MCDRFLITSVFPIRFVSLVSFVSVVALVSFVSLCYLVHKTGRFSGEYFPFPNWSLDYAPGVYSFFIQTPGHGVVNTTGWQYTKRDKPDRYLHSIVQDDISLRFLFQFLLHSYGKMQRWDYFVLTRSTCTTFDGFRHTDYTSAVRKKMLDTGNNPGV